MDSFRTYLEEVTEVLNGIDSLGYLLLESIQICNPLRIC